MTFQVEQIDHVELVVPDRRKAAEWYREVLGLHILPEFEFWADDPHGPLMIGTLESGTKLALFEGTPTGSKVGTGFHLVSFRADSEAFIQFLENLEKLQLTDSKNRVVNPDLVADHQKAFSIYFCDPYGNHLELTTYDYEATRHALAQLSTGKTT